MYVESLVVLIQSVQFLYRYTYVILCTLKYAFLDVIQIDQLHQELHQENRKQHNNKYLYHSQILARTAVHWSGKSDN